MTKANEGVEAVNDARKLALTLAKEFYGRANYEISPEHVVQAAGIFLTFLLTTETGASDPKSERRGYIKVLRHPYESKSVMGWSEPG